MGIIMGKIKQNKVKSRSHIKAVKIVEDDIEKSSSKEFTLIKPSSFSLANNVSGIVKSKEVAKTKSLVMIENPFGNIKIDKNQLLEQAETFQVSVQEQKVQNEKEEETKLQEIKEEKRLNKKERRMKKRKDFVDELKTNALKLKNLIQDRKNPNKNMSQFNLMRDALKDVKVVKENNVEKMDLSIFFDANEESPLSSTNQKKKIKHLIDPKNISSVPKQLRKRKHQVRKKELLAFKKKLQERLKK